jgi:hypothetical protein
MSPRLRSARFSRAHSILFFFRNNGNWRRLENRSAHVHVSILTLRKSCFRLDGSVIVLVEIKDYRSRRRGISEQPSLGAIAQLYSGRGNRNMISFVVYVWKCTRIASSSGSLLERHATTVS